MQSSHAGVLRLPAANLPPPIPGSWLARQGDAGLHCGRLQLKHSLKQPEDNGNHEVRTSRKSSRANSPSGCRANGLLEHLRFAARQNVPSHPRPPLTARHRAPSPAAVRTQDRGQANLSSQASGLDWRHGNSCNPGLDSLRCDGAPTGSQPQRYSSGSDSWSAARTFGRPVQEKPQGRPQSAQGTNCKAKHGNDSWPSGGSTRRATVPKSARNGCHDSGRGFFMGQSDTGMPFGGADECPSTTNRPVTICRARACSNANESHEEDILAALAAAKVKGSEEVRRVFKQLLLRWHPDKVAPSQESDANHVMRFLLDQRAWIAL